MEKKYRKFYLRIQVIFSPDGRMTPLCFEWHDGRVDIDHVLKVQRRAPQHVGTEPGVLEYTCKIYGRIQLIYYAPESGKWFIEVPEAVERDPDPDMI